MPPNSGGGVRVPGPLFCSLRVDAGRIGCPRLVVCSRVRCTDVSQEDRGECDEDDDEDGYGECGGHRWSMYQSVSRWRSRLSHWRIGVSPGLLVTDGLPVDW